MCSSEHDNQNVCAPRSTIIKMWAYCRVKKDYSRVKKADCRVKIKEGLLPSREKIVSWLPKRKLWADCRKESCGLIAQNNNSWSSWVMSRGCVRARCDVLLTQSCGRFLWSECSAETLCVWNVWNIYVCSSEHESNHNLRYSNMRREKVKSVRSSL